MKIGLVGLPNAGKSTFFNALLKRQLGQTGPYSFCTVNPNIGIISVPDAHLENLVKAAGSQKITPAGIKFIDIAGLIRGSHRGEGLGNQFLTHIREVDLICFVLADFINPQVDQTHYQSPQDALETLRTELILKDIETLEKYKKSNPRESEEKIENIREKLNSGRFISEFELSDKEKEFIEPLFFLTAKPYLLVLNIDEKKLADANIYCQKYPHHWQALVFSAKLEEELMALSPEEQKEYLEALPEKDNLSKLIGAAYKKLNLLTFYTINENEARGWPAKIGTTALEAAGMVHTDFAKNFIKAQVTTVKDFLTYKNWQAILKTGRARICGRDYKIQDFEVLLFKTHAC